MLNKRNWGRWGAEDEAGTLNLLTPDRVAAAASLVRSGRVYSLAEPLDGPLWPGRRPPWHVTTTVDGVQPGNWGGADDIVMMHTHTATHLDGLCHIWREGHVYNGFPAAGVTVEGAERCGVENVRWIVSRGVLLDIAGLRGVQHLDDAYAVTAGDLEEASHAQGVTVGAGDVLLVRTGWIRVREHDARRFNASNPGLAPQTAAWLADRDVVAIGADNGSVEVSVPDAAEPEPPLLHFAVLGDLGGYLIEYLNLEELARDRVYEFLFVAAPLRLPRGIGSPLSPLAIV